MIKPAVTKPSVASPVVAQSPVEVVDKPITAPTDNLVKLKSDRDSLAHPLSPWEGVPIRRRRLSNKPITLPK